MHIKVRRMHFWERLREICQWSSHQLSCVREKISDPMGYRSKLRNKHKLWHTYKWVRVCVGVCWEREEGIRIMRGTRKKKWVRLRGRCVCVCECVLLVDGVWEKRESDRGRERTLVCALSQMWCCHNHSFRTHRPLQLSKFPNVHPDTVKISLLCWNSRPVSWTIL